MVLDTSVLVSIHLEEPGFERLFDKISRSRIAAVGTPTLLEAVMVLSGRGSVDVRPLFVKSLRRMRVQVVPFTEDHYEAAVLAFLRFGKGRHPAGLNFGDCQAYAVAAVSRLPLLYTGDEFSLTDVPAA
jgi:ribonuclease VapC